MTFSYVFFSTLGFLVLGILFFFFYRDHYRTLSAVKAYKSLWKVQSIMLSTLDFEESVKQITNVILTELNYMQLGYVIIVLALVDDERRVLRRVGLSKTESADAFLRTYPLPYRSIEVSLDDPANLTVRVVKEKKMMVTNNMAELLFPVVDPAFVSNLQKQVGVKTSLVYPVISQDKVTGTLIFSMVKDFKKISEEEKTLLSAFTDLVGLAVQNSRLYTSVKETKDNLAKVNQEVLALNEKLKSLDKLKDDFVSIASHELRTPMTAIRSYAWMALNRPDIPLTEKMKRYLSRTLVSTERLINLVNDMLNISRIESGRIEITPKLFDIRQLVADVVVEIGPKAAEKQLNIHVINSEIPQVFADPDKVHQILLNLLGNSMKFTPNNGMITVSYMTDGNIVGVSVEDSGVGISSDDIHHLFTKFGRLDESYVAAATSGGTGLGLYICKSLIELMKGNIWASSEGLGRGTTFTFTLPVASKEVMAEAEKYTTKPQGEVKQLEPTAI